MIPPGFLAMRARLVDDGLIVADGDAFRVTPTGDAYVNDLIDQLLVTEGPYDRDKRGRQWNFGQAALAFRKAPTDG